MQPTTGEEIDNSTKQSKFVQNRQVDDHVEKNVAETQERIGNLAIFIDDTIENLDQKLDKVLEKNEKDFLTAYRFHMLKVQNELMQLKKKANETELKTLQDSKLAELDKEQHRFQMECMEVRRYCDEQEKKIKKLEFKKQILMEDQEFLDFELRDGKEQNASLKLALSSNLTVLDDQNYENEQAKISLSQYLTNNFNTGANPSVLEDGGLYKSFISAQKESYIQGGSLMEKNTAAEVSQIKKSGHESKNNGFDESIITTGLQTYEQSTYQQPKRDNETIQEEPNHSQEEGSDAGSRAVYDEDQSSEQMGSSTAKNTKIFRYQTKFNRPYLEGEGPKDANMSQNYNQKLQNFIQDELDKCKVDHQNNNIESVADNIEGYFKENLIRRFDQIQELKQKIAEKQISNYKKNLVRNNLQEKFKQVKDSAKLVETFRRCTESVRNEKQQLKNINVRGNGKSVMVSKDDLNGQEKRKVLEYFVENDDALGLLLDFISSKHMGNTSKGSLENSHISFRRDQSHHSGTQGQSLGSQYQGFSTQNSNSIIQNQPGLDGTSQTIYSTQYQLLLQNLKNNNPSAIEMQSQQNSLLQNHMLSNSLQIGLPGRGPLGHHQTEKEMWGVTNLGKEQRNGLAGPIMIGDTAASNIYNLTNLQTQNQLQISSTMGRNLRDQPQIPINNFHSEVASPYDINKFNTHQQMYQSFVRGNLNKKRQSQYSERKAQREQERFHQMAMQDLNENKNSLGLAKKQNQMMMNIQLNQPSVMKNSTGAGIGQVGKMGSPLEVAKIGLSSNVLSTGKKTTGNLI